MIFNQYRTSHKHGQYVNDNLPPLVVKALEDYLTKEDLAPAEPLFPNKDGGFYSSTSAIIGDLFEKLTGKRAHVNILRHARIVDFLSQDPRPSANEKKELARQMGHSVNMQAGYDRIDADGQEIDDDDDDDDEDDDMGVAPRRRAGVAASSADPRGSTSAAAPPRLATRRLRVKTNPAFANRPTAAAREREEGEDGAEPKAKRSKGGGGGRNQRNQSSKGELKTEGAS